MADGGTPEQAMDEALDRIEGAAANGSMQAMLHATSLLADERRVSRFVYLERRP